MALDNAPDLTKRPPRSPRVRLGGYVILPRMLDKGRATIAAKNGEYHFNCPMDQRFLSYAGVDAEALKNELAAGKGDGDILEWIEKNGKNQHNAAEIFFWSQYVEQRVPGDNESRGFVNEIMGKIGPKREDVGTWFEMLDADDHATFGGQL